MRQLRAIACAKRESPETTQDWDLVIQATEGSGRCRSGGWITLRVGRRTSLKRLIVEEKAAPRICRLSAV
jgi:hypothetical protein